MEVWYNRYKNGRDNVIKKVLISSVNHQGYGVARINNKVVFVENAITDDVVDIEIVKEYKKYALGDVVNFASMSKEHITSACPYYDKCGGCQISHITHKAQLDFKKEKMRNIFSRYLDMEISPKIISVNEYNYRNKVVFHIKDGKLGFYEDGTNKLIKIDNCLLLDERINNLIPLFNNLDLTYVEKIMVRVTCKEVMVVFYGFIDKIDVLKKYVSSIILVNIKEKLLYGKSYIKEEVNGLKFIISYNSFFQVNTKAMVRLYDKVLKYANLTKEDDVLDLFCGTGTIGIYLSMYCKSVLGVEIVEEAIKDANINKELNNIDNISFICGDVDRVINEKFNQNVLVVDPPRSGLNKNTKNVILNNGFDRIVYVSCDPMTLVRDLKDLSSKYEFKEITLVDMFPNTYHVESVCLLERR